MGGEEKRKGRKGKEREEKERGERRGGNGRERASHTAAVLGLTKPRAGYARTFV